MGSLIKKINHIFSFLKTKSMHCILRLPPPYILYLKIDIMDNIKLTSTSTPLLASNFGFLLALISHTVPYLQSQLDSHKFILLCSILKNDFTLSFFLHSNILCLSGFMTQGYITLISGMPLGSQI
ncbi:hypothetical protein HJG60_009764 [Phyllostomus discolor]|uniref:Uncharacterized protein n=1 Tax=Phyllostomus discolor TaxID=89673 RepID=A0A834B6Q0_9CHIR|nr:hypothetical protein HJG60_009764 [Phyllostomus discolor]